MRILKVEGNSIELGFKGEDNAEQVWFDVCGWKELYGDGVFGLLHQRPTDDVPYPCVIEVENGFVKWAIGAADVDIVGTGKCELRLSDGEGKRIKSVIYQTVIRESLGNESLTPPEPWESWVDNMEDLAAAATQAAEDAVTAAGQITGLTVSSVAVPAGTAPSVEKIETPGEPIDLKFSIPTAIPSLWIGTQTEYENLPSHNPDVLYFIIEPL